jgi:hypothetical protein
VQTQYLLKLRPDGSLIWADQLATNVGISDMVLDSRGNPALVGSFTGTADLNPARGTMFFTSRGGRDVFVMRLSVNGKLIWAETMGSSTSPSHSYDPDDAGRAIAIDPTNGDICVAGEFIGTGDFDPDPARTLNLKSAGRNDIFVTRLTSAGSRVWSIRLGNAKEDSVNDIVADTGGSLILAGGYRQTVDYDPGSGVRTLTAKYGGGFLLKLHGDSAFDWVTGLRVTAMATGPDNSLYTTGSFFGSVDFDPGPEKFILKSWDSDIRLDDIYVLHLSPTGKFIDAIRFGRDDPDAGNDIAYDLVGRVFVTGFFAETVDFDPGPGVCQIIAERDREMFLLRLAM